MVYQDKTKEELIKELQELKQECKSAKKTLKEFNDSKLSENTLQESEERYRLLFENSGEAILFTNPDGNIYSANPEACKIFGMSEREICKGGRSLIIDQEDLRFEKALNQRSRTGGFKGELNFIRKDKTKFPCEMTSNIFVDSAGGKKNKYDYSRYYRPKQNGRRA
jgi:PAS domain S-box-containing protein